MHAPSAVTETVADRLAELRDQMRAAVRQADARQAKALLETGAEVLDGLRTAFVDYAVGNEEVWQR
jgi:hypothetical protein